jgi:hypothetical protein
MQIELTEDEARVLVNLLDVAVKSAGLQAAKSVVHFAEKIEAAAKAPADVEKAPATYTVDAEG